MDKTVQKKVLAVLLVAALIPVAFALTQDNSVSFAEEVEKKTLDVQGNYVISAEPNQVEAYLGFENEGKTAQSSQKKNAEVMQKVRDALYAKGLTKDEVKTSSFNVYPVYDYPNDYRKSILRAYKTTHFLKIKTKNIDKVGEYIDAAVAAGANQVNQISFGLTDDKIKELRKVALERSGWDAREKADAIAKGLGVKIVSVSRASESTAVIIPYKYDYGVARAEAVAGGAPTEITGGQVEVTASLSVTYEIT